jgi:hypothetical protein
MKQTPPATDAEWVRQVSQRLRALENKPTTRVGDWVFSETDEGRLIVQKPGIISDVGVPVTEEIDLTALRGYVSPADVAQAVSGGSTSSLSVATGTQVQQDVNTAVARYVADSANALAQQLEAQLGSGPTGYSFSDTFDRAMATDLGAEFFRTEGGGAGQYGTDGTGFATSVHVDGAVTQWWLDRHVTPCNTDSMVVSSTLNAIPAASGGTGGTYDSAHALCARMDSTNDDMVRFTVNRGACALDYTLGGVSTPVIPNTVVPMVDGDRWDVIAIDAVDPVYTLLRNGLSVLSWTDFGHVYPVDSSHRFGGMYNFAGTTIYAWFVTTQIAAPTVQVFNVADRV